MVSRWDMHRAPPDILVTNASVLGTMLSREVEDRVFEATREWLASDPESYLFFVVDELYLVRGSAGTEVSFLIKSLLQRLVSTIRRGFTSAGSILRRGFRKFYRLAAPTLTRPFRPIFPSNTVCSWQTCSWHLLARRFVKVRFAPILLQKMLDEP